ncbi:Kinase-like protein [Mycena venus]|uniref:Kinase-like protein n=1 Tax=Mycena venus TaxID=2733690 RepID=A0A8H6TZ44_9AGAR|nr:Kinase-like protein [Mycena venus]
MITLPDSDPERPFNSASIWRRRAARRLEGGDAQYLVDAIHDVLNRGTLPDAKSPDSTTHRNRLQFFKEALVWQGLRHRFILPLLGIDRETFSPSFCMVSPWMKYGTVLKYLRDRGRGDVNRLLHEIAQGLGYLHSRKLFTATYAGQIS